MALGEQGDQRGAHRVGLADQHSLDVADDALGNGLRVHVLRRTSISMVHGSILTILPAHATS